MIDINQRRLVSPFTRGIFRMKYRLKSFASSPNYNGIGHDPLKIYWLDPTSVSEMMVPGAELSREYTPGVVLGGDWDQKTKPFTDSIYYQSFKQRFKKGKSWEETPLYKSALNRDPDNLWHGCSTKSEVEEKLEEYTRIYHSIVENGYLTQRELERSGLTPRTLVPPETQEVRVNIDRDGHVLFEEGRHRFSIATVLELERIPVIVMGRHKEWVENGGVLADVPELSSSR